MPALVAGIPDLTALQPKTWMAGTSPAMTGDWGANNESTAQSLPSASALAAQPHHDVDARDLVAFRWHGRLADHHIGRGNVEQIVLLFDEEVMVLGIVGVEIGFRAVDGDLPQQPDFGELVQRVVDGGERHRHFGAVGFLVEHFRGDVAVAPCGQDTAERPALPGRSQADLAPFCLYAVAR